MRRACSARADCPVSWSEGRKTSSGVRKTIKFSKRGGLSHTCSYSAEIEPADLRAKALAILEGRVARMKQIVILEETLDLTFLRFSALHPRSSIVGSDQLESRRRRNSPGGHAPRRRKVWRLAPGIKSARSRFQKSRIKRVKNGLISLLLNFTHTTSGWPWTEKHPGSREAPSAYFPSAELRLVVYYKPKECPEMKTTRSEAPTGKSSLNPILSISSLAKWSAILVRP